MPTLTSVAGKIILDTSMFVGRIGSLTMVAIFSRRIVSGAYRYSNARLMIGQIIKKTI